MSEEQFWHSNPRIISIWEKAWKEKTKAENNLLHIYTGNYFLSAMTTAIDKVLNGRKAKCEYMDKPLELFELTEEEKKRKQNVAIQQFMAWEKAIKNKYKKEGG